MKTKILLLFLVIFGLLSSLFSQTYWQTTPISGNSNYSIGTSNSYPFQIKTNNTLRMYIGSNGNVGLNTTKPYQMLHVVDGNILISKSSAKAPGSANGSLMFGGDVSLFNTQGSWAIEYLSQDEVFGLNFWKPWTPTNEGENYYFFLSDNGNVGIGTCSPQAKLAVNGGILAKSVKVNTNASYWPDFVFFSRI